MSAENTPLSRPSRSKERNENVNDKPSMLASFIYAPAVATAERLLQDETTQSKEAHVTELRKRVNDLEEIVEWKKCMKNESEIGVGNDAG